MINSKGVTPIIILILIATIVAIGGFFVLKNQNTLNNSSKINAPSNPQPAESSTPIPTVSSETAAHNSSSCNPQQTICFDKNEVSITVQEGKLENEDKWTAQAFQLKGKGSLGYSLSMIDFPKGISIFPAKGTFDDGTKVSINAQIQKNVVKYGEYSGYIYLSVANNSSTDKLKLTVKYTKWDESAINATPSEILYDKNFKVDPPPLKFYYLGNHPVKVESVADNGQPVVLRAQFYLKGDTTTVEDSAQLYVLGAESPNESFPPGQYTGYFKFIDPNTQKELLRVPYKRIIQ